MPDHASRFDDELRLQQPANDLPRADDEPPGYDEPRDEADEGEEAARGTA
jgi:hypothetical protein